MPRRLEGTAQTDFGDRMAALRKDAGYPQRKLAAELGISQRMVAYSEGVTDYPPAGILHDLGHIAMAYGVSTDELVFDDGKGVAGTKLDPELLGRFEKVAQLPEEEKNAVLLLDSVIAKHTIRKVMGS